MMRIGAAPENDGPTGRAVIEHIVRSGLQRPINNHI